MLSAFLNFISGLFSSTPPPAGAAYGFQWQAGQGVPAALTGYDLNTNIPAGIYVAFPSTKLSAMYDPFGRAPAPGSPVPPGTVFPVLPAPSAAMTNLVAQKVRNPPPGEAALFTNVTPARLSDLSGFLAYTANCLDIINHAAAGTQLLQRINTAANPVFITPANRQRGNQSSAATPPDNVNTLVTDLADYVSGQPIRGQQITAIVNQKYSAIGGTGARFNQLAADMNALPLCSLFVQQAAFQPNFLSANFRFRGQRLTGQNLQNWLSPGGFSVFDTQIRTLATIYQGFLVREFFLLALNIALYSPFVPPGSGTGTGILFNVRNEEENALLLAGVPNPAFRPPAIGLAHELMHAMHYGYGTAPGAEFGHYTTTAAELLFSGMGPFVNEPITENAVRGQWGTIPAVAIDASNTWAAPALRTIYELPMPPATPTSLRAQYNTI
jgi:hypothetical protein